jgi:hypothetical protein
MSYKDYDYKINLRNKFYKKTINKFIKINKSLELLNKYNKELNNQLGGAKDLGDLFRSVSVKITDLATDFTRKLQSQEPTEVNFDVTKNIADHIKYVNDLTTATQGQMKIINEEYQKLKLQTNELNAISSNLTKTTTAERDLMAKLESVSKLQVVPKLKLPKSDNLVLEDVPNSPRSGTNSPRSAGTASPWSTPDNSPRLTQPLNQSQQLTQKPP